MENCHFYNDQQLVNSMTNTLDDGYFVDLRSLFPEVFSSSSNNSNNTRKSVMETTHHVVEGLESPSGFFSFPAGKETGNNSSNHISFESSSSSSRFLGLLENSGRNISATKRKSSDDEGRDDFLETKRVCKGKGSAIKSVDHVLAEQKRREKMNQLFISLSKIVPGLKKLDKVTLIGDAIEYMKELIERVKILEEEIKKKISNTTSSDTYNYTTRASLKSTLYDMPSSQKNSAGLNLDIKARITKNSILIKMCCKKQKAIVLEIQHQMELLDLEIVDTRIIPFGDHVVDITILAQKSDGFCMTADDIVRHLRLAL